MMNLLGFDENHGDTTAHEGGECPHGVENCRRARRGRQIECCLFQIASYELIEGITHSERWR
jgi:hypothetical protein